MGDLVTVQIFLALAVAGVTSQGGAVDTLENHPDLKLAITQSQRQIRSVDGSFSGSQPGRYDFGLTPSGRLTVGDLSIRTVAYGNGENAVATVRPSAMLGKDDLGYSKLTLVAPEYRSGTSTRQRAYTTGSKSTKR